MNDRAVVQVSDSSHAGEARRAAAAIAARGQLSDTLQGRVAIVATEMASNLQKHAKSGGEILMTATTVRNRRAVDLLTVDRGPGIADVDRSMSDGFSTRGTQGNGLGAVRRLSTEFDIYSDDKGSVVFSRILDSDDEPKSSRRPFQWGVACRPVASELRCGDTWRVAEKDDQFAIMIADGLGHGPAAEEAGEAVAGAFDANPFGVTTEILRTADNRARGSRGAAMSMAQLTASTGKIIYGGVGNVSGFVRTPDGQKSQGLVSHNGTLGVQVHKLQQFEYNCPPNCLLVMFSDGLQSGATFEGYAGLNQRHPAVIAGVLYRDFTRGRDDVTVAIVRIDLTGVASNG